MSSLEPELAAMLLRHPRGDESIEPRWDTWREFYDELREREDSSQELVDG